MFPRYTRGLYLKIFEISPWPTVKVMINIRLGIIQRKVRSSQIGHGTMIATIQKSVDINSRMVAIYADNLMFSDVFRNKNPTNSPKEYSMIRLSGKTYIVNSMSVFLNSKQNINSKTKIVAIKNTSNNEPFFSDLNFSASASKKRLQAMKKSIKDKNHAIPLNIEVSIGVHACNKNMHGIRLLNCSSAIEPCIFVKKPGIRV